MKLRAILFIASALSLTACASHSTLKVPPSTPASVPALPAQLDKDPAPVQPLANNEMGTVVQHDNGLIEQYGVLGVRYQSLRAFYACVATQLNDHKSPKGCL